MRHNRSWSLEGVWGLIRADLVVNLERVWRLTGADRSWLLKRV